MTVVDSAPPALVFGIYSLLLVVAALCDAWKLIVPNVIPSALTALFIVAAAVQPGQVHWLSHFGAAAAVLAAGLAFFTWGWLGGGDVKLIAALSLWTGFAHLLDLLVAISLAGGALALVLVVARRLVRALRAGTPGLADTPPMRILALGESVPYAVAIAPAAIYVGTLLPFLGFSPGT